MTRRNGILASLAIVAVVVCVHLLGFYHGIKATVEEVHEYSEKRIELAQDRKSSGTVSSDLVFRTADTPHAYLSISPNGKAELVGRDGKIMAILYADGFVDYRTDHNVVVHTLADLAAFVAGGKHHERWVDLAKDVPREEMQ